MHLQWKMEKRQSPAVCSGREDGCFDVRLKSGRKKGFGAQSERLRGALILLHGGEN